MKLVIAEKPSVAQSLARMIGATKRQDGYLEGNGYLVSWCVGHLVELSAPQRYDERYTKWRLEDLPILPENFLYEVSAGTRKQYQILKGLMERPDVESLVCATDAGREGELIFRLVYNQCRCKKPFERLWISSMEDAAIREGFAKLKPGTAYDALYEAALCRERADWIVGMNATRLFSCLYGQTLAVGRVMTPTLAMVVERDAKIAAFRPEPFWTVQITAGGVTAASPRYAKKTDADNLAALCLEEGKAMIRTVETKEKLEKPPLLYDLTSLQRDANRILGFTAQQTLDYTQSLYEKKLVTYPRTDSRYLTDDMREMLPELITSVAGKYSFAGSELRIEPARPESIFDSGKVTDHHAIIPTKTMAGSDLNGLSAGEKAVLQLVSARLLSAAAEDHRYAEITVRLTSGAEEFIKKGRTILTPGWKAIWQHFYPEKAKDEEAAGPVPAEGSLVNVEAAEVKEGKTSPPKYFTEDTLLSAMETAGAEETPDEAERKGLGTPATRAATIEKLVQRGFIERKGDRKTRRLVATDKGTSLITVMPEQIQSPSMTVEWEQKLLQVEHRELGAEEFMNGIEGMIAGLVSTYKKVKGADALMSRNKVIGTCPHCGAEVLERQKGWFCSKRECRFVLWKDNAYFTKIGKRMTGQIAEKLLRDGRVRLKDCKSQKTGRTYNADLLLSTEDDGRPRFSMEFEDRKGGK
ncbi:DNA topoisomerase [Oribacterium sp. oral taxon 078 str. F0263]|uniref:DNA topoisomerase 3 n=1 Tax=Oribacterium sp. oral taxon 078 TaxID=652706 RepID=UPI0003AE2150|nr:DNA topoisomerase 3 [Oribacterium sp. oral taxon 078]ERL22779.1 DNA topoisomerase [Oribacterium sp. oral taxon 078 str. F0263]